MGIKTSILKQSLAAVALLTVVGIPAYGYSGEDFYVCRLNPAGDNYLSLRTCGSTKCREILRMGPDMMLTSMEPYSENGWREVIVRGYAQDDTHAGMVGWVFEKYICPM